MLAIDVFGVVCEGKGVGVVVVGVSIVIIGGSMSDIVRCGVAVVIVFVLLLLLCVWCCVQEN